MRHPLRLVASLVLLVAAAPEVCLAIGAWNGQDVLHVPISWCIVQGSPAQASPNVAGDTVTDDLIWRRHERPTDNIYANQAGMTFRSAINDAWTVLDFPIIPDPDTTLATPGDMRGEDVSVNGVEFNALVNSCDTAWTGLGRAGIGITAVNAGLFHDGAGTYVGVAGWGGCSELVTNPNICATPYEGRIVVVDNHYLFPTVPNRQFPGTTMQFLNTDPVDQVVGHEFGHAHSLEHRALNTALMNPSGTDNDGDGQNDNVALNATEVSRVRASALLIPGLEKDPPGRILKGDVVETRRPDKVREGEREPGVDLSAVAVSLDRRKGTVSIGQQLFGLISKRAEGQQHWFLIDNDGATKGADARMLAKIGVPQTRFVGADLVVRVDVRGERAVARGWRVHGSSLGPIAGAIRASLPVLVMHPHFLAVKGLPRPDIARFRHGVAVHHTVAITLPQQVAGLRIAKPFRVEAIVAAPGVPPDALGDDDERATDFILEYPSFPHCFPRTAPRPGDSVSIDVEGLKPAAPAHGLLGASLVFKGQTDQKGGVLMEFTVPKDARPGVHLVTVGNERTALTADCALKIRKRASRHS